MVKDFDAERRARRNGTAKGNSFKLGGETFYVRSRVHPDALAKMEVITDGDSIGATLESLDEFIFASIDPAKNAHDRYRAVRANTVDVVDISDLLQVMMWLVDEVAGRPIEPRSSSGTGRGTTRTRSTVVSSSRAKQTA